MKRKKRNKCDLNENENDVLDLPSLEIVTFGWGPFRNSKTFELFNLNSLKSVEFGYYCFEYADFSLKGE